MKTYDVLIRVSKMNGRKTTDESTMTVRDQNEAVDRVIADKRGRRGKTFEALDQSGFTIHESEVYPSLLERVRSGKSAGFVVAYGDRLSRNWRTVGGFFDDLEAVGAEYVDASAPEVDYRTDEGRMLTGMKAVMGEVPSLSARRRSRRIADETVARGVPNRVPYGYRRNADVHGVKTDPARDAKALVPDEATAPIVRRIFEMRADGYAWAKIVSSLNEAGVPAPNGGQWTGSSLSTIVRNIAYTGVVRLGGRRLEGAHEPLVSVTQRKRAQSARPVVRNGNLVAGIAGSVLECSGCGKPLSVIGTDRSRKPTYGCRRQTSAGACPRPVYVSKEVCDAYVHDAVRAALASRDLHLVSSARELEQARVALERASAEKSAFVRNASALDEEDFRIGYEERRAREAEAAAVYNELLAHAADADEMPTDAAAYDALDLTHQRRVARSLIERIVVGPPTARAPRDRAVIERRLALEWKRGG